MVVSVSDSGGYEGSYSRLELGSTDPVTITYNYEHFSIPDRFIIRYGGQVVLDTGFVGGAASGTLDLAGGLADFVEVVVATDDEGTAWNYAVSAEEGCGDTSPFILSATGDGFQHNEQTNRCEAAGTITVGHENGLGALLRATGATAFHDDDNFSITGAFTVPFVTLGAPLFTGTLVVPFDSGVASTVTDTGGAGFKLGNIDIVVKTLALTETEVRAGVDFVLPDVLGSISLSGLALIFHDNDIDLGVNGKVNIPDADFKFFNLFNVEASDQTLAYDAVERKLTYQGELKLDKFSKFFGDATITLNLTDDNHVAIGPDGPEFVGSLTYESEAKFGGWGLKKLEVFVDTTSSEVKGTVIVSVPFGAGLDLGGTLGFLTSPDFHLNTVGIHLGSINKPLPFAPAIFLQSVDGTVDNIAANDPDPVSLTGALGFSLGPELGDETLIRMSISATVDENHLEGTGSLTVIDEDILTSTGTFNWNWDAGTLRYTGAFNIFDGFITTSNDIFANTNFDFSFGGTAAVTIPDRFRFIGGESVGSANYRVGFTNDGDLSNDYASAWSQFTFTALGVQYTRTLGVKLTFDGSASMVGAEDIPEDPGGGGAGEGAAASLGGGAGGGFNVGAGEALLLLTASWTTAQAGDVPVRIRKPDGTTVEQANFAANGIDIIEEFGSSTSKTVAVVNPAAGLWTIEIVNPAGLGTVDYAGAIDNVAPTLGFNALPAVGGDGVVAVGFTGTDPDSNVTLDLFYDTDGTGFNGVLIASGLAANGAHQFNWDTDGIAPGTYRVYGVLSDGVNAPVQTYAPGTVTLARSANLSVDVSGPQAPVVAGDNVTFTIAVQNTGPTAATGVVLKNTLPAGYAFVSSSVAAATTNNEVMTFNIGSLASGATQTITLVATATAQTAGAIADATVLDGDFAVQADPNVEQSATLPHVSVQAVGDGHVDYYRFTVSQAGAVGVFDIDGTNGWDSYIRLRNANGDIIASSDDNGGDPGSTSGVDSRLNFTFQTAGTYYVSVHDYPGGLTDVVEVGRQYTLHVTLAGGLATAPTAQINIDSALVTSDQFDPDANNNSDFAVVDLTTPQPPNVDLAVTATAIGSGLSVGDDVSYVITVTNNGPNAAQNVVLRELLSGVSNINATPSQGTDTGTADGFTAQLGQIASGASATVTVTADVMSVGDILATSRVTTSGNDVNLANNEFRHQSSATPGTPLDIDLSVNVNTTGRDGTNRQRIVIDLNNAGPGVASGVNVQITLPKGAAVVAQDLLQGTFDTTTGLWTVGNLRDNLTRTLTLTLDSTSPFGAGVAAEVVQAGDPDIDSTPNNHVRTEDDFATGVIAVGAFTPVVGGATGGIHTGGAGADAIYGLGGDDTLEGGDGNDVLVGGDGVDTLNGQIGDDALFGGAGDDALNGGDGSDTVDYSDQAAAMTIRIDLNTATGAGSDTLTSVENAVGGSGADTLRGDGGANTLEGGAGDDNLDGGAGENTASYRGAAAGVTVSLALQGAAQNTLGAGGDTLANFQNLIGSHNGDTLTGDGGANKLSGLSGVDTLNGGDGADLLNGGAGADTLNGGAGTDTASYEGATAGVTANLEINVGADVGGVFDTYDSIENLIGSSFNDSLVGKGGVANVMSGGDGDDQFVGEGIDAVNGGAGNDVFFAGGGGTVNVNLAAISIETIWGSVVGDVFNGATATANLVMIGAGGADQMTGGSGADFLYFDNLDTVLGGAGSDWAVAALSGAGVNLNMATAQVENAWGSSFDDVINASASTTAVVIVGDVGADTMTGGSSGDFLYGFDGADRLKGGAGGDILVGDFAAAGNDVFVYDSAPGTWGVDTIWDFVRGQDKISLVGSGLTAFNQLNIQSVGNFSVIVGAAGGQIWLRETANLDQTDFIFV